MARRLADRTTSRLGLAIVAALVAFLIVNSFVYRSADSSSITVPVAETSNERAARLAREQIAKDWKAAQRRVEVRSTESPARRFAWENVPTQP
jgi:hypothetical protein